MANYKRFKEIAGEIVEVSEAICEARPVSPLAEEAPPAEGGRRRGLFSELQATFACELERLAALAAASLGGGTRGEGLAALELATRTAMMSLGASLLERLLATGASRAGQRVECPAGHRAVFVPSRDKTVGTVVGPVKFNRAYYHCADCHIGVVPKDDELGAPGATLSPGLQAMVDRVGSAAPFTKAAGLLPELAGTAISAKRIERRAEADGAALLGLGDAEADALSDGSVVPLVPAEAPEKLYVVLDGTGVPMVPAEVAGRASKAVDGRAQTREVRLGVCFTQTELDNKGRPLRDPGSSSYVVTFEGAERFGRLIATEAARRGSKHAGALVVLGDGAGSIWNLAGCHFPAATQIVDLYHAREHLHAIGALVAPALGQAHPDWLAARLRTECTKTPQ